MIDHDGKRLRARVGRMVVALLASTSLGFTSGQAESAVVADAAMRGDIVSVRLLLEGGADVNASQGDGMTALHWAARRGEADMAESLVLAGANVKAVTRLGDYAPLHLAAREGRGSAVRVLLAAGADPGAPTSTGDLVPLHFAAAAGDVDAVRALLEYGAEVDAEESQWGQTPLMFAAASNREDAAKALLEHGADPSRTGRVVDISAREELDRADQRRRDNPEVATGDRPAGAGTNRAAEPTGFRPQEQLLGTTEIDPLSYADLVGTHGGLSPLLLAVREGHAALAATLLAGGADIDQVSAGDRTSPLLMAFINGHFDLGMDLLERGADPGIASDAGATPLYAVLNTHWQPKSRHPQPTDYRQQRVTYLEAMEALLDAGADVNAQLTKPLWYTTYNNDLLNVDRTGATPFWRAAYATDVAAMRLLIARGADPTIPTVKAPRRSRPNASPDTSGLAPVPVGGPAVYPIHAASGAGYGQGYAANAHRHAPDAWLAAVKYLVEELGAEVDVRDVNGYSAVHHAASRGDNELILYLVERGADVTFVSRRGQTTVDMANGPVQRIQPFPETVALLERLGARNNHNCVSC